MTQLQNVVRTVELRNVVGYGNYPRPESALFHAIPRWSRRDMLSGGCEGWTWRRYAHPPSSGEGMSRGGGIRGGHVHWGEESGGGGGQGQDQLRGVRVSSTASGLQAMRTGAKREVPMPPETFTGVVRPLLSQSLRPLARQVGRSQLETRAP
jgi:hypothetical protein